MCCTLEFWFGCCAPPVVIQVWRTAGHVGGGGGLLRVSFACLCHGPCFLAPGKTQHLGRKPRSWMDPYHLGGGGAGDDGRREHIYTYVYINGHVVKIRETPEWRFPLVPQNLLPGPRLFTCGRLAFGTSSRSCQLPFGSGAKSAAKSKSARCPTPAMPRSGDPGDRLAPTWVSKKEGGTRKT